MSACIILKYWFCKSCCPFNSDNNDLLKWSSSIFVKVLLYNVLPISRYIGNITIKWYNQSMSDNRDPTVVLHQEIYTLPVSVASDTRCF